MTEDTSSGLVHVALDQVDGYPDAELRAHVEQSRIIMGLETHGPFYLAEAFITPEDVDTCISEGLPLILVLYGHIPASPIDQNFADIKSVSQYLSAYREGFLRGYLLGRGCLEPEAFHVLFPLIINDIAYVASIVERFRILFGGDALPCKRGA